MIATICKSCDTVSRTIIDRCKYCGSRQVEVRDIDISLIKHYGSNRETLVTPKKK